MIWLAFEAVFTRVGSAVAEDELAALTSEIIETWRRHLRRGDDDCPRSGDRGEAERLLVTALLRASLAKGDETLSALAGVAARYGTTQGRDRLDPGGLCDELAVLRQIVWTHLREKNASFGSAVDRILRFDRALSIVTKAAVTASYSR